MNPSQLNSRGEEIPCTGTPLSSNFGSYGLRIMRAKNMLERVRNLCEARKLNLISNEYLETVEHLNKDLTEISEKFESMFNDFMRTLNKTDGIIKKISVLKESLEQNNQNYDIIVNVLNTVGERKLELEKSIKNHEIEKDVIKNFQLKEAEEIKMTINQLKIELQLKKSKYQEAEDNKNIVNQKYGELLKSFNDVNEKYEQLRLETCQFKTNNDQLLDEKSKMQNSCIQKINETNVNFEKNIKELIEEFDTKIDRTDEMNLKLNEISTQIKQLEDQMVESAKTLTLHQSQMTMLKVDRNELNNQLAEKKRDKSNTLASHLEIIKNLKDTIAEMTEKSKFERDVIDEQEKKYSKLMVTKRTYGSQINLLTNDNLKLSNELSKLSNKKMVISQQNNKLERCESLAENNAKPINRRNIIQIDKLHRMTTRTNYKSLLTTFQPSAHSSQGVSNYVRFTAGDALQESKETLDISDFSDNSIESSYHHLKNPRQRNPSVENLSAYIHGVRLPQSIRSSEDKDIISNTPSG